MSTVDALAARIHSIERRLERLDADVDAELETLSTRSQHGGLYEHCECEVWGAHLTPEGQGVLEGVVRVAREREQLRLDLKSARARFDRLCATTS